jgi:hypothetical protein
MAGTHGKPRETETNMTRRLQRSGRPRFVVLALVAASVVSLSAIVGRAQERLEVFILAADRNGDAITDLKTSEITWTEDRVPGQVLGLERVNYPVKVTVLVDNGLGENMLVHLRSGLRKFFEGLPDDVEVALIATAPNPRWLVKPTSDRVQIEKGINLLTPENDWPGRFSDALVEYSRRLEAEFGRRKSVETRLPYMPVVLSIGSTSHDGSQIRLDEVKRMLTALRDYGAQTNFVMVTGCAAGARRGDAACRSDGYSDINEGGTVSIAKAAQELTRGRYDAITGAASSSLNRILPEIATQIAARHARQTLQYRVSLERPPQATGPIKNVSVMLAREGSRFIVTPDGIIP